MRVRFAGKTDVGLQRDHNEDALLVMPAHGVMVVADGLGGHRSGHIASELCVSTLSDFFSVTVRTDATWPFPYNDQLTDEENYLFTGIRLANRRIFDRSLKAMSDFGMGTTCVGAMFSKDAKRVSIANVGDSRCYRIRGKDVKQLTRDHSLVSDAVEAAPWMSEEEIARLPPNVITRALGIREDVVVDLHNEPTHGGDIYLVCSDGLCGPVGPGEMRDLILTELDPVTRAIAARDAKVKTPAEIDDDGARIVAALERASAALVDRANYYGGPDNVTVVVSYVEPPAEPEVEPDPEEEAMANTERGGSERPKAP